MKKHSGHHAKGAGGMHHTKGGKMARGTKMHVKPIASDGFAHSSHGAHNRAHGTPKGFAPHDGYMHGPTHCTGIGCNEQHD